MNTRELGTFTGKVVVGIAKEKRVQQWKGWGGERERREYERWKRSVAKS